MPPETFFSNLKQLGCDLQPGRTLKCTPEPLADIAAVRAWWEARQKEELTGWAQFTDANVLILQGQPDRATSGVLLAAELYLPDAQVSHHLRQTAAGWVGVKIEAIAQPGDYLQTQTLLGRSGAQALTYEIAWTGSPLRRAAFRLVQLQLAQP